MSNVADAFKSTSKCEGCSVTLCTDQHLAILLYSIDEQRACCTHQFSSRASGARVKGQGMRSPVQVEHWHQHVGDGCSHIVIHGPPVFGGSAGVDGRGCAHNPIMTSTTAVASAETETNAESSDVAAAINNDRDVLPSRLLLSVVGVVSRVFGSCFRLGTSHVRCSCCCATHNFTLRASPTQVRVLHHMEKAYVPHAIPWLRQYDRLPSARSNDS